MTRGASQAVRPGVGEDDGPPPEDSGVRGEGPDWDDLFRAHSGRLIGYLLRRAGKGGEAVDLMQEAVSPLVRLGRARSTDIVRPEAYLQRVARNLAQNRAKSEVRRSARFHVVADDEPLAGPDQHRLLESRDMLRRVEKAMLKLKPRTREIFMAHRLDGMSYAEIAEQTGLSVKGVEKQMSKAIAHIDRMLDRR